MHTTIQHLLAGQQESQRVLGKIDASSPGLQQLSEIQTGLSALNAGQMMAQTSLDHLQRGEDDMPALIMMAPETGKGFVRKDIAHFLNPSNVGKVTWRLWFVDPITLMKAPTGEDGRGYKLKVQKGWLTTYGPALRVSLSVLKAVLFVGRVAGVHADELASGAASGLDASTITSEEMADLEAALGGAAEAALTGGAEDARGLAGGFLEGSHYRLVRQMVTELVDPPDSTFQRAGLDRAIGPDKHVEWVLKRDVATFAEHGAGCLHDAYRRARGLSSF